MGASKVEIHVDEQELTLIADALVSLIHEIRGRLEGSREPLPEPTDTERVQLTEKLADLDALLSHLDIRPEDAPPAA